MRRHFLKIRRDIPAQQAKIAALCAADNFLKFIKPDNFNSIAFYYPIHGEIDPLTLYDRITSIIPSNKKNFALLPTITGQDGYLLFHPWQRGEKLIKNKLYPKVVEAEIQEQPVIPDIMLVPLVAFDLDLHRIGYGTGFYDRTIRHLRHNHKVLIAGYAYDCQKSASLLPADQHDMQLDCVITDVGIYPHSVSNLG